MEGHSRKQEVCREAESEGSSGYRPNRGSKDAIQKIKDYAEQGYIRVVVLNLSKYFDTLNYEKSRTVRLQSQI